MTNLSFDVDAYFLAATRITLSSATEVYLLDRLAHFAHVHCRVQSSNEPFTDFMSSIRIAVNSLLLDDCCTVEPK
jgi:hypothetical protein